MVSRNPIFNGSPVKPEPDAVLPLDSVDACEALDADVSPPPPADEEPEPCDWLGGAVLLDPVDVPALLQAAITKLHAASAANVVRCFFIASRFPSVRTRWTDH
ncbi:MAG: hypothetical protein BGO26_13685 [Actinobacteria bacterium 69-20]|nr:MAG: hypothetical protein BGO26_13685 [Actinobacteria bacterium 69-20]